MNKLYIRRVQKSKSFFRHKPIQSLSLANPASVRGHPDGQLGGVDGVVDARVLPALEGDAGVLQGAVESGRLPPVKVLVDELEVDPGGQLRRMAQAFALALVAQHPAQVPVGPRRHRAEGLTTRLAGRRGRGS